VLAVQHTHRSRIRRVIHVRCPKERQSGLDHNAKPTVLGVLRHQLCRPCCRARPFHVSQVRPHSVLQFCFCNTSTRFGLVCKPSGISSAGGEQCLVASGSAVHLEPCLDAVAAGDGREVMQFDGERCLPVLTAGAWEPSHALIFRMDRSSAWRMVAA